MFIPMKVRDHLRNVRVPDDSGRLVPLVMSETVLYQAQREPERTTPPALFPPLAIVGLLLGGGLAWLARKQHRAAGAVAVTGVLVLGILGGALFFLRFMTKHVAAYSNVNMFVYNPLWLAVVVAYLFAGNSAALRKAAFVLATIAGALTAFGIVAPFIPGLKQGSFAVIALAAPLGLAAAFVLRERMRPVPAA
jgi:hypothetical protein